MKITDVEAIHLRRHDFEEIADGTQGLTRRVNWQQF